MTEVKAPLRNTLHYAVIELTQGNINNHHLYLSSVMALFPSSAVGGGSEEELAKQLLEVHSGIGDPVRTDIAGDKKIFRKRAWVRFSKRTDWARGTGSWLNGPGCIATTCTRCDR